MHGCIVASDLEARKSARACGSEAGCRRHFGCTRPLVRSGEDSHGGRDVRHGLRAPPAARPALKGDLGGAERVRLADGPSRAAEGGEGAHLFPQLRCHLQGDSSAICNPMHACPTLETV